MHLLEQGTMEMTNVSSKFCFQAVEMASLDTMPMLYAFEDMESGGKESGIENDFAYRNNVANASQKIRMGKSIAKDSNIVYTSFEMRLLL